MKKRQYGGTLAGLIVGLLIGLAVALGVAMYVTKAPVPLMDRGVTRKPDQDAQEQERNKDWNPNSGLGSKSVPTTPSAPAEAENTAAPAPEAVAPAPTVPASPAKAPAQAPAPAASSKTADPLGDLMQSRAKGATSGDKAASNDPSADPFQYYVQAGAFRTTEDAEAQRAKLAMMGLDAKVSEREQAGKPVFRVRMGPFGRKVEADILQERLKGQGVETALVRVQR